MPEHLLPELRFRTEHENEELQWLFLPPFGNRHLLQHRSTLLSFTVSVVSRLIHSAAEFAMTSFGKCACVGVRVCVCACYRPSPLDIKVAAALWIQIHS